MPRKIVEEDPYENQPIPTETLSPDEGICPKCGSPLGELQTTKTGKQLQRCSAGGWNPDTKEAEGCDYVRWVTPEPETLDEKCPKCGAPLMMQTTRSGKKMKKCSKGGWDREAKKATGCDYVEWMNGTREELDEDCPMCGAKLVFVTTANGKKMKKCSTSGWDSQARQATGCTYIQWVNDDDGKKGGRRTAPGSGKASGSKPAKKEPAAAPRDQFGEEAYPDFEI